MSRPAYPLTGEPTRATPARSRSRRLAVAVALTSPLWLYHGAAAEESTPGRVLVVVLPTGSSEHASLADQLAAGVEAAGLEPIDAEALAVGLPPEIEAEVGRLEDEARQRELALDLPGALEARRAVVEALEGTLEASVDPARLAAALARVAATEVAAGDRDEAIALWRRTLALEADLTLDATYSPSAREAFDEARRQGGTLPLRPSRTALDRLCAAGGLTAVLWVAAGRDETGPALVRLLHIPGEPALGEVRYALPEDAAERQTLLGRVATRLETDLAGLGPSAGPEGPVVPPPVTTPLWRQWWLWTVVGVAVAGAATATGLVLGLGERQVDVEVRFP